MKKEKHDTFYMYSDNVFRFGGTRFFDRRNYIQTKIRWL